MGSGTMSLVDSAEIHSKPLLEECGGKIQRCFVGVLSATKNRQV
jgi:hypothetical protein